jgi:hypothetical protein
VVKSLAASAESASVISMKIVSAPERSHSDQPISVSPNGSGASNAWSTRWNESSSSILML